MKRIYVSIFAAWVVAAVFALLVHTVLVAAHVSEPAAMTVSGLTARRIWAASIVLLALLGLVLGVLAVSRPEGRFGTAPARIAALIAGVISIANGALVLAVASGGPGTGNGVVGGAAALILGLIAVVLGGVAMARSRAAG